MPYGVAKCALNFAFRKVAAEHPGVTILMLTPGVVMTGFGDGVFPPGVKEGLAARSVPFDDSVNGLVKEIDAAGFGEGGKSGEFRAWNGEVVGW